MAVTTFAGGINRGTAVCPLSDGTVVVASNQGQLTRFDHGGTEIESTTLGATALALAAHPAGDGVLAAVSGDGLYDVRFGAAPSITKVAGLASIRGVAVDVASGSALITGTSSGRLVRVPLDGSGTRIRVATGLTSPGRGHHPGRRRGGVRALPDHAGHRAAHGAGDRGRRCVDQ